MCVISGPVNSVASTKIFTMPSRDGSRQLVVYSNAVDTPVDNVMILPVPRPETVEFERVPDELFVQCASSFFKEVTLSVNRGLLPDLEVRSHGSYSVVLAASVADLDRVPTSFTQLTREVTNFLASEYPHGFGFLLCKLKDGHTEYTPFAYSHAIGFGDRLFTPTKHFHMDSYGSIDTGSADWDHEIYTALTDHYAHNDMRRTRRPGNQINWARMPNGFQMNPSVPLNCFVRKGSQYRNEDLQFRLVR